MLCGGCKLPCKPKSPLRMLRCLHTVCEVFLRRLLRRSFKHRTCPTCNRKQGPSKMNQYRYASECYNDKGRPIGGSQRKTMSASKKPQHKAKTQQPEPMDSRLDASSDHEAPLKHGNLLGKRKNLATRTPPEAGQMQQVSSEPSDGEQPELTTPPRQRNLRVRLSSPTTTRATGPRRDTSAQIGWKGQAKDRSVGPGNSKRSNSKLKSAPRATQGGMAEERIAPDPVGRMNQGQNRHSKSRRPNIPGNSNQALPTGPALPAGSQNWSHITNSIIIANSRMFN